MQEEVEDLFLNTSENKIGDWVLVEYKVAMKGQKINSMSVLLKTLKIH